jgi:hypothetical protein
VQISDKSTRGPLLALSVVYKDVGVPSFIDKGMCPVAKGILEAS